MMLAVYGENCEKFPFVTGEDSMESSNLMSIGVKDHAIDPGNAEKLWKLNEPLTGVHFSSRH